MKHLNKYFLLLVVTLCLLLAAMGPGQAADPAKKVIVLPFKMNAAQDTTYLQQGIQDMLISRLEWPDRVSVASKAESKTAFDKLKGNVDQTGAMDLGK
ncbi:MAG: hypothetical protein HQK55_16995, partial [Deltaproteobacteria bacterium]|nr:hypothetical protein [Deltaproteobacteria bacterium]